MTVYLIFEVCVLTGICCVIYRWISSHWNPGDGYGNLRRLARGVGVFLLAVVVLEPQQNTKYYISIISNSLFLLLVSINTILVLAFLSSGSVKYFVDGYKAQKGAHTPTTTKWHVCICINFLILDVYTFAQHWDHIGTSFLLGKVWSALVDYYCVSVTALIAVNLLMCLILIWVACVLVLVGVEDIVMVILGDSIVFALTVWITYTVASSLGASTFIYMESVLRRYNFVILILTVALVGVLWEVFNKVTSNSTVRGVDLLAVFTLVTTAAAVGVALDTPLPEHDAGSLPEQDGFCATGINMQGFCQDGDSYLTTPPLTPATPPTQTLPSSPHVPPDSRSTPSATPTQRCREIDRDDPQAMELGQLVHLHYLDQEGERRALKVMEEVAGVWRSLGRHLECDVEQIAQNYMSGMHYSLDCCHEVLVRWFNKGGTPHYPLSWNGLVRVLEDIGLGRVADHIHTALKCVIDN